MEWLPFTFIDLIDIFLFGMVLYGIYRSIQKSGSRNLLIGIFALVFIWVITSQILQMKVMGRVMDTVMGAGLLVLIILFQEDIRRLLNALGSSRSQWFLLDRLFKPKEKRERDETAYIAMLTFSCVSMARKKTGALIVLEQKVNLELFKHTGEVINADVNSRLIENIFFKNSPLHDGAMIISQQKIAAAGCILPVSQDQELPKELGLRHRAALGMSEQSDAKIIIISEERGEISIAHKNNLIKNVDVEQLQLFLSQNFTELEKIGTIANKKLV